MKNMTHIYDEYGNHDMSGESRRGMDENGRESSEIMERNENESYEEYGNRVQEEKEMREREREKTRRRVTKPLRKREREVETGEDEGGDGEGEGEGEGDNTGVKQVK